MASKDIVTREVRTRKLAVVVLLLGATGIGFAPIFVRVSEVGLSATAAWRLLLAAAFLAPWTVGQRQRAGGRSGLARQDLLLLVLAGLFFAGDLGFWHWALALTSVANATLFTNLAPIFVALVGWLWLRERLGRAFLPGLILAIAGASVLVLLGRAGAGRHSAGGDGLAFISAIFYASYQLSVKRLRARASTLMVVTVTAAVSGAVLAGVAAACGETLIPVTLRGWVVVLGLAVVSHIGGQGLIAYAMGHLPASFASVSLLLQPVVAAVAGWVILSEAIGPLQALGGVFVLAGIYLARRGSLAAGNRQRATVRGQ